MFSVIVSYYYCYYDYYQKMNIESPQPQLVIVFVYMKWKVISYIVANLMNFMNLIFHFAMTAASILYMASGNAMHSWWCMELKAINLYFKTARSANTKQWNFQCLGPSLVSQLCVTRIKSYPLHVGCHASQLEGAVDPNSNQLGTWSYFLWSEG